MAGLFASLLTLLGIAKTPAPGGTDVEVVDVYRSLREQVFTVSPAAIGLKPVPGHRVWGVVMETGYATGVATLVALSDGTVSLYFSGGGGMIGLGEHEGPRHAARDLISAAQQHVSRGTRTTAFPLPKARQTKFFFLTFDGVFTAEAKEDDLGENRVPLSPLFHTAQKVITQARLLDEQRRDPSPGSK